MSFKTEVFDRDEYQQRAAEHIAGLLPSEGSVVLTGGTTAEKIYPLLARIEASWSGIEVLFSDERCVPPGDPASNYGMADNLMLTAVSPKVVHRMKGEESPGSAAGDYNSEIAPLVQAGLDLVLLGMGADNHIGAMFPGSRALDETDKLCVPVDRPDGMQGLTLTPPAMLSGGKILLLVTGDGKAEAVAKAITSSETPSQCPVRLLSEHPDVTFLLDEASADRL